ncbi:hypothetical protein AJ79_06235 [Helicocarpus griseus UAMH5409]|uniref:DH domain-containing protein n=1 Tax=Helicocarpus griseus UAMH5409 TaxID=1447875 RepID=A0A2B7XF41_9EURO|nr:hypothetical protein AJ79_06235 [Helicocarpus griseus UAMH5409]
MDSIGESVEEDSQRKSFGDRSSRSEPVPIPLVKVTSPESQRHSFGDLSSGSEPAPVPLLQVASPESHSFKRWIRSMRRRQTPYFDEPPRYVVGWPDDEKKDESYRKFPHLYPSQPDQSSTASSSNLRTIKTASMANLSVITRPRTNTQASTQRSACHSSVFSGSDARVSIESNRLTSTLSLDEGAWNRAVQRRQVIREVIDTEVTYLAGLKSLAEILTTLGITQTALERSTQDLIRLHSNLLNKLQEAVPRLGDTRPPLWSSARRRMKFGGADASRAKADRKSVTTRKLLEPIDSRIKASKSIAAEPNEAAMVAQIIQSMLPQFKLYEDYGVKYQLVSKEIDLLRKSITCWEAFDHGIEASLKNVLPTDTREAVAKQCFTLSDLLMRPIQRVCKYQLFLTELLKSTPVADCPSSHSTIEGALQRTLSTSQEINRATGDPVAKDRVRKTMLLGERLEFSNRKSDSSDVLHDFGPIKVCGVLHVAYQTKESVNGEYMMCCLFNKFLLLATASESYRKFNAVAIIHIPGIKLEAADSGTGLHCVYAPFSWKMVFEMRRQTFEIILTACSEREETQWKENFHKQSIAETPLSLDDNIIIKKYSMVQLPMKSLSAVVVDGQVHNLTRRSSVHGSLFSPPSNADCVHLLIKGTRAVSEDGHTKRSSLGRSQSVQLSRQSVILAPKKQDRIRLERWSFDIWTCDIIPYPGMPLWKGEHLIRSSAESFMRKLSSRRPFTKRSCSLTTTIAAKSTEHAATPRKQYDWDAKELDESLSSLPAFDKYDEDGHEEKHDLDCVTRVPERQAARSVSKGRGDKKKAGGIFGSERLPTLRKKWSSMSIFKGNSPTIAPMAN